MLENSVAHIYPGSQTGVKTRSQIYEWAVFTKYNDRQSQTLYPSIRRKPQ